MSDYRRWISYIYAYENGVRKRNAGYAKLELKDGNLTMTLHVTPDNRDGKYRVCLYKNQPGHREGILLGEIEKRCGGDCTRFVEDAADLKGSGLLFQEMNGMLLYDENGKCLISSWEDAPVDMTQIQEIIAMLRQREGVKDKSAAQAGGVEEGRDTEGFTAPAREGMETKTNGQEAAAGVGAQDYRASGQGMARENSAGWRAEKRDEKEAEVLLTGESAGQMNVEQTEKGAEEDRKESGKEELQQAKVLSMTESVQSHGAYDEESDSGLCKEKQVPTALSSEGGAVHREQEEEPAAAIKGDKEGSVQKDCCTNQGEAGNREKEQKKGEAVQKPGRLESRIFSCLPAMYPFEHQEFERSVRMEPQDIGLLPREMWKYAGNSFLLHSYYAYHHILFVRRVRKEQRNCYLMLPGVYEPKEQHMAQLFGFSRFCPVRKKALQRGDFGYWYMEVGFSGDAPEGSVESGGSLSERNPAENMSSESRE